MFLERHRAKAGPPSYQQITFGRGTIRSARFAPDGQTIVYSAAWDDSPLKLFLKHPSSPDSLPLELPSANLLGISSSGEMAIAVGCRSNHPGVCRGTLARAALTGGAPRDVAEGVQDADWAPDGQGFLVVRDVAGKSRIEFPVGKLLYETSGHVTYARLSPKGDRIAFLDHEFPADDAGTVAVIDLSGKKTTLTTRWASEHGLAWSPSGEEIWFTATEAGANRSLYAVTLAGPAARGDPRAGRPEAPRHRPQRPRAAHAREPPGRHPRPHAGRHPGARPLLPRLLVRLRSRARRPAVLLFDEEGEAGGANYTVHLRKSDRSPVVRLGEGNALALSPDGRWALSMMPVANSPFFLLPTGTGDRREVATPGISPEQAATWLPDSRHFLFAGTEAGHGLRLYVQGIDGEKPRPIGPEGILTALPGFAVSSDGKRVAAIGPDHQGLLVPLDGGEARALPGVEEGEVPLRFSADGRSVYLWKRGDVPARDHAPRHRDRASARPGRTCCPPIPRGWSASRTCWSPPTARATRTATRGSSRISSSSRASSRRASRG